MKITVEFDTNESDEHKIFFKANDLLFALCDFQDYIRKERKYAPDDMNEEVFKKIEEIENRFLEIVKDNNVEKEIFE